MRNVTLPFAPSVDDLFLLPQRVSQRAKAFAFHYGLDDLFGRIRGPGSMIAEPTFSGTLNSTMLNSTATVVQAIPATPAPTATTASASKAAGLFSWQSWKTAGGIFQYISSKWAIVTLLMAFLNNRTQFYASPRIPLNPKWPVRLGIYLLPIVSILYQIQWLLQGIRCQSSPNWPQLHYGNPEKHFSLDYAGEGGFAYWMSSMALGWESEEASCANVSMSKTSGQRAGGSLALLWPLFLSLCLSAFVETLACAVQGRQPVGDTKMMELSLAFAEAESMVLKPFEMALAGREAAGEDLKAASTPLDKQILLAAMNVSPEMLIISLLWACNNLTSMILSVFGLRNKYRLLNTGFWGVTYFVAIGRSIFHLYTSDTVSDTWIFRFPTVFLVGFLPHLIVILGMLVCLAVYIVALVLTAATLPPTVGNPHSIAERFAAAYRNLNANVHFSHATPLRFRMSDDFYTTILATGFAVLTAASEAVYLNEGAKVRVSDLTWVERKRVQELSQGLLFMKTRASVPTELRTASHNRIEALVGKDTLTGYAIERKARSEEESEDVAIARAASRHGRWALAMQFLQGIFWLILGLHAKMFMFLLDKTGIAWRPHWLRRAVGESQSQKAAASGKDSVTKKSKRDFWMRSDDVEVEFRRRYPYSQDFDGDLLDDRLYDRWKNGEWWGEVDTSGDYEGNSCDDDDTSSVISMSTNASEAVSNHGWDAGKDLSNHDGARTPTQQDFAPSFNRDATPDTAFDSEQLATLLDPRTVEQQQEARMLAQRLRRPGIMTRSQYRRQQNQERAAVLSSSRYGSPLNLDALSSPISKEDEERLLEQFVISRRNAKRSNYLPPYSVDSDDWNNGAEGLGSSGPQTDTKSYSRLYVP
ncbi:Protein ASI3 [Venturia nashicola]|nr:Protein ASI3 [Venturia nashicola]